KPAATRTWPSAEEATLCQDCVAEFESVDQVAPKLVERSSLVELELARSNLLPSLDDAIPR
ncbi:hypothetical protein, partial [Escherichia coli]|uniref:hypothetical protein n=1 Tax=Escherichia coli TaxID=562 RepID=UPI00273854DE